MRVLLLAAAIAFLPAVTLQAAETSSAKCHRLAGDPRDPAGNGDGAKLALIDAPAAIGACRAALAAQPDDPRLSYELGRALEAGREYVEAMDAYETAADRGSAPAMRSLGLLYQHGKGVDADFGKARALYEQSLVAGFQDAASELGVLYVTGAGTTTDNVKALELFRQAAAGGDPLAMMRVGRVYAYGLGVAQNDDEALKWYRQSADAGEARGQLNLGVFHLRGRGGLEVDPAEAARFYRLAAEGGNGIAMVNLSGLTLRGEGVERDVEESLRFARAAIETGDSDALAGAHNAIAWGLATTGGDLDEALTHGTAAVEGATPDSADWLNFSDTVAWVHHKRGDHAKALELMQAVVAKRTTSAVSHDHLGDIYASLGRKAEAKDAWRKALALAAAEPTPSRTWDAAAVEAKLAAE